MGLEVFVAGAVKDFLDKMTLFGIPALVLGVGIIVVLRMLGMKDKWLPLAFLGVGITVSVMFALVENVPRFEPLVLFVVASIFLGLAIGGVYLLIEKLRAALAPPPAEK